MKKVVAGIIIKDGKVLLTQRCEEKYDGKWEFPGGKVEEGETPENALIREIKEELDVNIIVKNKFTTIKYNYPDSSIEMDCFLCELVDSIRSIHLNVHNSYTLIPINNIPDDMLLPADVLVNNELKKSKFCFQCRYVCKNDKVCKNFEYGIMDYHVCFYDDFGNGIPTCFDESFYDANDREQVGLAVSYVGSPGIRVFVNYHDNSSKELVLIDCDRNEASYLDGTNELNKYNKDYDKKHKEIVDDIEYERKRRENL